MQSHNDVSSEDDILSGLTSFEHAVMCFDAIWVFLFDQDMLHICVLEKYRWSGNYYSSTSWVGNNVYISIYVWMCISNKCQKGMREELNILLWQKVNGMIKVKLQEAFNILWS